MLGKQSACVYIRVSVCINIYIFKIDIGQIVNVSLYIREYKTNLDHKLSQFALFYCYRRIKQKNQFLKWSCRPVLLNKCE